MIIDGQENNAKLMLLPSKCPPYLTLPLLPPLPPPTTGKPTSHNAAPVTIAPTDPKSNRQTNVTQCPSCHHRPRDPNINRLTDVTQCPTCHHCPPPTPTTNRRHTMPLLSPLPPPTPKAIGKPTSHNAPRVTTAPATPTSIG